jgi:dihydrofolate reductase
MRKIRLSLIAALSADGFISRGRGVPWHLPADQAFFRRVLAAHEWLLVGAQTFAEMQGCFGSAQQVLVLGQRALPSWAGPQCLAVASVTEAMERVAAACGQELLCLGGAMTYAAALPLASQLWLTRVDAALGSGLAFPPLGADWQRQSSRPHAADAQHAHAMNFEHWIRET